MRLKDGVDVIVKYYAAYLRTTIDAGAINDRHALNSVSREFSIGFARTAGAFTTPRLPAVEKHLLSGISCQTDGRTQRHINHAACCHLLGRVQSPMNKSYETDRNHCSEGRCQ